MAVGGSQELAQARPTDPGPAAHASDPRTEPSRNTASSEQRRPSLPPSRPRSQAKLVTPDCSCSPGAQAASTQPFQPAGPAIVQPTVTPDSYSGAHPGGRSTGLVLRAQPCTCAQAAMGASNTLIRRSFGAAWLVSTQVQDLQQPLALLLVEIFPPHQTPDGRLLHLGSPLRPQVVIKSRIAVK